MTSTTPSATTSPRSATAKAPRAKNSTSSARSLSPLTIQVGRVAPRAPSPDPEIARLRAEIESLETKLALYRRREQLDLEYSDALSVDELRKRIAPIVQTVCAEFSLPLDAFWSRARTNDRAIPRHIARYLARTLLFPEPTVAKLGQAFNCDHGTILNSVHVVEDQCSINPTFAARVQKLRTALSVHS